MTTLVSREQWGAEAPTSTTPLDRAIQEGTALHYTAAARDEQRLHSGCAERVRRIQDYHQGTRGWADIAYSYLACRHGYLFEGRGVGTRTAGQGTTEGNDRWHAVCFLGDDEVGRADVTPEAKLALIVGIDRCNDWSGARRVEPHSFFHATQCPGDELRSWLAAGMPLEEDAMATVEEVRTVVHELLTEACEGMAPSDWHRQVRQLGHEAKNNARAAVEAVEGLPAALGATLADRVAVQVAGRLGEILTAAGVPTPEAVAAELGRRLLAEEAP